MTGNPSSSQHQDSQEPCPECGAPVVGGRVGCQAVWDELSVRAYQDLSYAPLYNLAFDAYCMQHPATYCHSAKSYAAHLTRLCCGVEYNGAAEVYAAIQKWLNGAAPVDKPPVLEKRGSLTVADLRLAAGVSEYRTRVQDWAENVWAAYASQHELARRWVETARQACVKKDGSQ